MDTKSQVVLFVVLGIITGLQIAIFYCVVYGVKIR